MFSTYPDEWPGTGLFLLRVAIGIVLIARGVTFLLGWRDLKFTAAAIALASACGIIFWSWAPAVDLFQTRLTAALMGVIAMALVCLGPGAFSLDARLFGRQEIIFPETKSEK
jgi:uncharacterized membrane protein YphA (DoxX/SURF4 family)